MRRGKEFGTEILFGKKWAVDPSELCAGPLNPKVEIRKGPLPLKEARLT